MEDITILVSILIVWPISVLFAQMLRPKNSVETVKTTRVQWPQIYSTYKYIRDLCNLVNKMYGQLLSIWLADAMFFFISKLDLVISTADSTKGYQWSTYLLTFVITFVLAADISENVICHIIMVKCPVV